MRRKSNCVILLYPVSGKNQAGFSQKTAFCPIFSAEYHQRCLIFQHRTGKQETGEPFLRGSGSAEKLPKIKKDPHLDADPENQMVVGGGFGPPKAWPVDLQSTAFDRSATPPGNCTWSG